MEDNKKVSVIIPVYNAEKYIKKCVNSVLAQTYFNIEIIIIDDGSTDKSKAIIEEIANKHKNIKFISRENKGVLKTRYEAISISKGEYIMFIDADDYINNVMIENMMKNVNNFDYDVIRCGLARVNNKEEIITNIPITNEKIICKNKNEIKQKLYPLIVETHVCNSMDCQIIKKEKIGKVNLDFNIEYAEDLSFNLELYSNINSIILLPEIYYYYRYNDESKTNKMTKENIIKNLKDTISIYPKLFDYLKIWDIDTNDNNKKVAIRNLNEIVSKILSLNEIKDLKLKDEKKYIIDIFNEEVFDKICKIIKIEDINKINDNRKFLRKQVYNKNIKLILLYNRIIYKSYKKMKNMYKKMKNMR